MRTYHHKLVRLVLSAVLLAMAQVLPFLTGQIPQIGSMLCPMHLPVFLCGFFCGPLFGVVVGALAPILRSVLFGMPPMFPTAFAMCFELAAYGLVSGLLYRVLKGSRAGVYLSLIVSMLAGRALWGAVNAVLYGLGKTSFSFSAFIAGGFVNAIPGILLQICLIPPLVILLTKAFPSLGAGKKQERE